jgi:hypothetical protein
VPTSLCALAVCLFLQVSDGAKPLIDNERVVVYEFTLAKGKPIAARARNVDAVKVWLTGGMVRTTSGGKSALMTRGAGDVEFEPKGTAVGEELVSEGDPAREVVIELRNHKVEPLPNTSGYPEAFPRSGSRKIIDNDSVTVWDYAWRLNLPTAMHFHSRDVVVIYLENGVLRSITPDGDNVDNDYPAGSIRFNTRNRVHFEQLISGAQRAIITELK